MTFKMIKNQRRSVLLASGGLLATGLNLSWPSIARAQSTWPDKPVKFILSQPPGSGPDNVARLMSERLAKLWGQPVVVENKPGGQNVIGAVAAAKSPADGYHLYFATTAALVTNPLLFKTLPYDPQKDFTPVSFVARSPFAVLVPAGSPVRSLDDLVARAKAANGQFTLGNEGPRTFSGMIARLFNARAGLNANLVSYASVAAGIQNLVGGHVEALVADLASTAQLARQERLRVIATTSGRRVAGWDQVPALSERYGNFDMAGWFAIVAPTGTPADLVQRMNRDLNSLLADRDLSGRIAAIGPLVDNSMAVNEVRQFLANEHSRWVEASKEIGLLPE
jgi:tripartite-type tricarboxylate transporter receptor subunit TctC